MRLAKQIIGKEVVLWVPLIGFDRSKSDKGVEEFLSRTGFIPDGISLFVYNADFFNLHGGMEKEYTFPKDFCNYFGAPRNDIRSIQPWSNYDLRELVKNLKKHGVHTYACVMGNHLPPDENGYQTGLFGFPCRQQFVEAHPELNLIGAKERGYLYPLKRFSNGTFFEDYFPDKVAKTLADYGIEGIHLADAFCPPCIQICDADWSDDMLGQFISRNDLKIPKEISLPLENPKSAGIAARADYMWNRYRAEWIRFISDRWAEFFGKLSRRLHKDGLKVSVCNAWTSEPFEAVYRYGIDYKKIADAGVDRIYLEDQATAIYSYAPENMRFLIHEYMHMPMLCKAYAPEVDWLFINYAKDSSEEGSVVNHAPCADEREIYTLSSKQYISGKGCECVGNGFFVTLADSVTADEWRWIFKRYGLAFKDKIAKNESPAFLWSDSYGSGFLEEYISTRRLSLHRQISQFSRRGTPFGAVVKAENLDKVSGALFVANIDLLPEDERRKVLAYDRGTLTFTLLAKNKNILGKKPDVYFEDMSEPRADYRMATGAYTDGVIPYSEIVSPLNEPFEKRLYGQPEYVKEPNLWYFDLVFQEVSDGFMQASANLIRLTSECPLYTRKPAPVSYFYLSDGRLRVYFENDNPQCYTDVKIYSKKKIAHIDNTTGFPVQPLKLISADDRVIINFDGTDELVKTARGFVLKAPPGGIAIADITFKKDEK